MKTASSLLSVTAIAVLMVVSPAAAFGCKPDEIKGWMAACDSVTGATQAKCNNRQCHNALHRLVEEETIQCYVASGLGQAADFVIYQEIDAFCHGEGPDPASKTPPPSTSAPLPTASPIVTAPVVTESPTATSAPPTPSSPNAAPTTPATPTVTTPSQAC